jgi:hypothetical protein
MTAAKMKASRYAVTPQLCLKHKINLPVASPVPSPAEFSLQDVKGSRRGQFLVLNTGGAVTESVCARRYQLLCLWPWAPV